MTHSTLKCGNFKDLYHHAMQETMRSYSCNGLDYLEDASALLHRDVAMSPVGMV